jgi:spore coat protein U-like protein
MRIGIIMTASLLALLTAVAGEAATESARMNVTVRVVPNCRIAVTDLAFGAYDPLVTHSSQNLDGTALVRVMCTKNERATVLMEEEGSSPRSLKFGSYSLDYGIFTDSARTRIWGGAGSGMEIVFDGGSSPQELTVYGRIPAGQVVPAGSYADAVTATVDF